MKKAIKCLALILLILGFLASCDIKLNINTGNNGSNTEVPSYDEPIIPTKPIESSTDIDYKDTYSLSILEFNDMHGHIERINERGGISNASYLINQIRNEDQYDNTVLIANGDIFQETAISRLSYGRVVIDAMNEMGFDAFVLGNHEFDWGLDKILQYWDGDSSNGEAEFPLLNSNIFDRKTNALISSKNGNILTSTIVNKGLVNVGIIGYIGNVYSSISKNMVEDYLFKATAKEISADVLSTGARLKDNGADIIVVSIHDGNSDSPLDYLTNTLIGSLKYNGEYLVDAVINGHTHTSQAISYSRDGVAMPIVQSSPYSADKSLKQFGRIDLKIDTRTKDVIEAKASHVNVSAAKDNYDLEVERIVEEYLELGSDILNEVYCYNEAYIDRYSDKLQKWVGSLMMAATGATAAICNTGGIRAGTKIGNFGFAEIYNMNPFDNHIILVDISGKNFKDFIDKNGSYYFYNTESGSINTGKNYKLAVIDYVYYSNYFKSYQKDDSRDTGLIVRDLMIEELRCYKATGFNINDDYATINIKKKI